MEIRQPKPVHSCREFLAEIGVIVIGAAKGPGVLPASLACYTDGLRCRLTGPISVGVWVEMFFQFRLQISFDNSLCDSVRDSGYSQRPLAASSLVDLYALCSGLQLGTWKLESRVVLALQTGQKSEPDGTHPTGFLSYGADCQMQAIVISEGRRAPVNLVPTDPERIELYNALSAYAGSYSIKGDIISHHIEASWNQAWTGTTQSRHFKIEGKTLEIKTLGQKNPDRRVVSRDHSLFAHWPMLHRAAAEW